MKLRDLFISNAAAATLALGMMQGSAWAEDSAPAAAPDPVSAAAQKADAASLVTKTSVTLDPLVPVGAIAGLGALYAVFCVMAAQKRMNGAWLRMAGGTALAVTLLNPEIRQEERQPLPTEVVVVVDKSASQKIDDRMETTEKATQELREALSGITGVNVRIVEVGKDAAATDGTELFTPLKSSLADVARERLGAVFIVTDGQVHDIPSSAPSLIGDGVPLHALISGHETERDRRIVIEQAPRFEMVGGEPQEIKFTVNDSGIAPSGGRVKVTATVDGQPLGTQFVVPGTPVTMKVPVQHAGANIVELKAENIDGELTTVNNRVVASVEGIRQNLNVLLVSGSPDSGVRVWRDILKSDPDVNLLHLTMLRTAQSENDTPLRELSLIPVPADEIFLDKIAKFDLIIFDRYTNDNQIVNQFHLESIAERIKAGGAMLMIGGPEYADKFSGIQGTALADILPTAPTENVLETPFVPHVTSVGAKHPVTRDLAAEEILNPWGRWVRMVEADAKSEKSVLMDGADKKPLLVMERAGKGRVATLLSDNSWLWARGIDGGGPHAELLRQVVGWLVKDPSLEEEAIHLRRAGDKLVVEQQTMADQSKPIMLTTPSGQTIPVKPEAAGPGLFRAVIDAKEIGLYRAEQDGKDATSAPAFISIGPANPREFTDTRSTPDLLAPDVAQTKGHISRVSPEPGALNIPTLKPIQSARKDAAMGGSGWAGIRMTDASILKDVSSMPLIPAWLGFAAVVGMMAAAWAREGDWKLFPAKKETAPDPGARPSP